MIRGCISSRSLLTDWAPPTESAFDSEQLFDVKTTFAEKIRALDAFEGALKPVSPLQEQENLKHLAHLHGAQAGSNWPRPSVSCAK